MPTNQPPPMTPERRPGAQQWTYLPDLERDLRDLERIALAAELMAVADAFDLARLHLRKARQLYIQAFLDLYAPRKTS